MTKNSLRSATTIIGLTMLVAACSDGGPYMTSPPYGQGGNQPQAMAAPAPAPAPQPAAQTFTVYFRLNHSDLSRTARDVVANAASVAKQNQSTVLTVNGYTDTSGGRVYNQILAQRRADSVRHALIAQGIAPNRITTHSYGETNLAVPTKNGVRNAQNRRVEIVISP